VRKAVIEEIFHVLFGVEEVKILAKLSIYVCCFFLIYTELNVEFPFFFIIYFFPIVSWNFLITFKDLLQFVFLSNDEREEFFVFTYNADRRTLLDEPTFIVI